MSDFSEISAEEAEIVRIMSKLPEFSYLEGVDLKTIKHEITHKIAQVLREYYLENTRNHKTDWTSKFKKAGISDDDGKSVISSARRLGIEI
jgi:NMD protein affecting ribosome stability and mRNA decay